MLVVNTGKDRVILSEYNGKRYAFRRGIPMDVPQEVYNYIILSEHVSVQDLQVVQEQAPRAEDVPVPIVNKPKVKVKIHRGRKGKR